MNDREQFDRDELVARSRAIREQARETIATAQATIARSRAIIERLHDPSPHAFAEAAE